MTKWFVLALVPMFVSVSAFAAPKICGLAGGSSLQTYEDSVDEIGANVSPVIAGGLRDLYSLPDVQNLLRTAVPDRTCVTAVAVSKNIYQYNELLVVISFEDTPGNRRAIPMLFQTASVQAHENTGPKPWAGFARKDFTALFAAAARSAAWQNAGALTPAFSPLDLVPRLFAQGAKVDPLSASYLLLPGVDSQWSTYLVTRLKVIDTGNPFTTSYPAEAGLVQVDEKTGSVRMATITNIFSLKLQMEDLQFAAMPRNPSLDHVSVLRELAL